MLNALWIVLLGMAIIFAALGILLLAMVLLGKLRSTKEEDRQKG
jgi:Na+-transporting methylmalonyl-CoA/oxaloacetate decarboxylase gamma subunit